MSGLLIEATIKVRRDTAGNFTSNNPTLNQGEFGYETDTGNFKIGDGSTAWTSLNYSGLDDIDGELASLESDKITGSTDQICKAWVRFDGTASTPITPDASFNVTDITKNGTGDYTINYTTNIPNANYAFSVSSNQPQTRVFSTAAATVSSIRIVTSGSTGTATDAEAVSVIIYST